MSLTIFDAYRYHVYLGQKSSPSPQPLLGPEVLEIPNNMVHVKILIKDIPPDSINEHRDPPLSVRDSPLNPFLFSMHAQRERERDNVFLCFV